MKLATIGKGRFATVELIRDVSYEVVAIKVILGNQQKSSLMKEYEILKTLQKEDACDSIIDPIEVREWSPFGTVMIIPPAMGGSLHSHIAFSGNGLSITVARQYTSEIIKALVHLSSMNCVHRDIKANNVLVSHCGHVLLCDFNQAKFLQRSCPKTYTLTGVAHAMAPEAIAGVGYDCCIDWWGLGVLVHEMLTGRILFQRPTGWPTELDCDITRQSLVNSASDSNLCETLFDKTWRFSYFNRFVVQDEADDAVAAYGGDDLNAILRRFEQQEQKASLPLQRHALDFMQQLLVVTVDSRLCLRGELLHSSESEPLSRLLAHPWVIRDIVEGKIIGPDILFDSRLGHAHLLVSDHTCVEESIDNRQFDGF